jgi:NTP pyrophosphatase (non-canonical NTP hydrolase)
MMLSHSTVEAALAFRRERDWEQFHTPQNLAIALAVEASELLEHFQWLRPNEPAAADSKREAIELEVADIAILLSYFVHDLGIDLDEVVRKNLLLNSARYPVHKSHGNATKYSEL